MKSNKGWWVSQRLITAGNHYCSSVCRGKGRGQRCQTKSVLGLTEAGIATNIAIARLGWGMKRVELNYASYLLPSAWTQLEARGQGGLSVAVHKVSSLSRPYMYSRNGGQPVGHTEGAAVGDSHNTLHKGESRYPDAFFFQLQENYKRNFKT